ncbi:MAG TPA: hypothetical protein VIY70_09795 [Acidimicrobiia bacterium]
MPSRLSTARPRPARNESGTWFHRLGNVIVLLPAETARIAPDTG